MTDPTPRIPMLIGSSRLLEDADADHELALAKKWIRSLLADLDVLGAKYLEAARSPDKLSALDEPPQLLLMAIVGRLNGGLRALPTARSNPGLAALSDLQGALAELCEGNQPDVLQPISGIGTGGEGRRRAFVKKHALLCVKVLVRAGYDAPEARDLVARKLVRTGHVGRQGGAIKRKTLWEWETRADDDTKRFLARNLELIANDGVTLSNKAAALRYAENLIDDPSMQSKILTAKNPTSPPR